ncbi:MAG: hypothetical protein L3J83_08860 [Proteobacteria bacterium]|nr:hypothetical protein [Pseudomonadota bacterium]
MIRVTNTVIVNKPLKNVFSFLSHMENLNQQLPDSPIDDYTIEVDDDIDGKYEVGTVITFYLIPVYENDNAKVIELEVVEIIENKSIITKLVATAKYDEKLDDWVDNLSLKKVFGDICFNMYFQGESDKTIINYEHTAMPNNWAVRVFTWLSMFINMRKSKKHMQEWVSKIESKT